jgi:hypothetical protein
MFEKKSLEAKGLFELKKAEGAGPQLPVILLYPPSGPRRLFLLNK